jgi:hypothetical protein
MPKTKYERESDKALLARVTKEMAQPRVAESAKEEAEKQTMEAVKAGAKT